MAEFLIQAKPHWMDSIDPDTLFLDQIDGYNARVQMGDIIVIKPNGWVWGREECLPNYIVIQIPSIDVKTAESFVQPISVTYPNTDPEHIGEEVTKMSKKRRYALPKAYVQTFVSQGKSVVKINVTQFNAQLVDKADKEWQLN